MSVSLITFANLGTKHNLKTPDVLPVVKEFHKNRELGQVLCQVHAGSGIANVASAIPAPLWYTLRLFEKASGFNFSRTRIELLFDFFASRRLKKQAITIVHGGYALPRTTARAHELGSVVVDLAVSAHIHTNASIEREELRTLDLPEEEGWYVTIDRETTHASDFDYVIALSEFVRESYVQSGIPRESIYMALPDIDTERFAPLQRDEHSDQTFRLVYSAFTITIKGLHYLLDAWEELNLVEAELVIIGGFGAIPESFKKVLSERIARSSSIVSMGPTTRPEEYYQQATALVFPSLTEGFGRVTLEAMACGIPVITTENARGIVEDGKTGFVVPIRDVEALKEKILYLYNSREEAREMGKAARLAVEQKRPFGEAVYEIYQDILKREGL